MFSAKDLSGFVCKAADAVELKFVRKVKDLDDDKLLFRAAYTHQVFGENESVFGYQNLQVKLYYTPDHLDTYIGLSYRDAVTAEKHGVKPDSILHTLTHFIPRGYYTNLDEFCVLLNQQKPFVPLGHLIHCYSSQTGLTYEVYKVNLAHAGFRAYHARLQPMLLWFIEAASLIDEDEEEEEEKWQFYLIYQRCHEGGILQYSIVGFASVYSFYCYPDRQRARISQMLIFPQFQRQGHGRQLLQTMYSDLCSDDSIQDITVEDPSQAFSSLRDIVDCCNAYHLPVFQPPTIHDPFEGKIEREAREKLKLHKAQARRVYEILRLKATDCSDAQQYRSYRLAVKNRLNGPYQREVKEQERLKKFLEPEELALTHPSNVSFEEHLTSLHEDYQQLEIEYRAVIEKLAIII